MGTRVMENTTIRRMTMCVMSSLTMIIMFCLCSCRNNECDISHISVEVPCYGYTEIGNSDELMSLVTYETSDKAVAILREGCYIYGVGEGKATISVINGEQKTVYDVTVTPAESHESGLTVVSSDTKDFYLPENTTYIGCTYNALSGEEFDLNYIQDNRCQVLDWDRIYYSSVFLVDNKVETQIKFYSGTSSSEYLNAYSNKTSASMAVKFKKYTLYENKWSKETNSISSDTNIESVNQYYAYVRRKSYILRDDGDGYAEYMLPEVWEKLMGYDETTVEEFVNTYGTHVVVGTDFGQSFQYDYMIVGFEKDDINLHWVGYYNGEIGYVPSDCINDSLSNLFSEEICNCTECENNAYIYRNMLRNSKFSRIRGQSRIISFAYDYPFASEAFSFLDGQELMENWIKYQLPNSGYDCLIAPRDEHSLYPVWEMIPTDTDEGRSRKEEFLRYMSEHTEK